MATITINGTNIQASGDGVIVINERVFVGGNDVTPEAKEIRIEVHGDIASVNVDACHSLKVSGSVGDLRTTSGDVSCSDVLGNIKTTSGDVQCKDVRGSVETISGDVNAATIHGKVRTIFGDVR